MKQAVAFATSISIMAAMATMTLASAPTLASPQSADHASAMIRCRSEPNDARRLACYDRAAGPLALEGSDTQLAQPTSAERRARQQARFGLRADAEPAPIVRQDAVDTLDGTVSRVVGVARDRFIVTLADRSVWQTTEPARIEPAAGNTVHIRRGALGSYLASFNKARSIRIERVR